MALIARDGDGDAEFRGLGAEAQREPTSARDRAAWPSRKLQSEISCHSGERMTAASGRVSNYKSVCGNSTYSGLHSAEYIAVQDVIRAI